MANIVNYLKRNKIYSHDVLDRNFTLELKGKNIILKHKENSWSINADNNTEYEIQEILEKHKIEIRFCEECGTPFDAGFVADGGFWYCCENCFEDAMNKCYGKEKWRGTENEGDNGGFYESLNDDGEWEDTSIYYTEWY